MTRRSTSDYPANWKGIARQVKDAAGWQCIRCGHPHSLNKGYILTVHHLDLSPANCAWWNLVALCQRCHLRIQGKVILERVWMWEHSAWFKPYVAGYYAHVHELPEDRPTVEHHADLLIALGQGHVSRDDVVHQIFPYVWYWKKFPACSWNCTHAHRKNHRCRVLARGALNSVLVQFADGERVITSRYAVRKAVPA